MSMRLQETLAVASVVLILAGLPAGIWYYEHVVRPAELGGDDAQVITLTGISEGGVWTTESVQGLNYWHTEFEKTATVKVDPTRPVVLRVRSADVLHSFSIPALRIRPIDVYPGHEVVVRLEPEDLEGEEELGFLCWQVCGEDHEDMKGDMVMLAPGEGGPDEQTLASRGESGASPSR